MANAIKKLLTGALIALGVFSSGFADPPKPVYTTSNPVVTNSLQKGTGPQSIGNGDLSGDVTTSGSMVTTLANSGVTAGTYGDATHIPQITFDIKGRATNATTILLGAPTTGADPFQIGSGYVGTQGLVPATNNCNSTAVTTGSICLDLTTSTTYQLWPLSYTPARVQECANSQTYSCTFGTQPVTGDVLYAYAMRQGAAPAANTGWTQLGSFTGTSNDYGVFCHVVSSTDGTSYTPATGSGLFTGIDIVETSGTLGCGTPQGLTFNFNRVGSGGNNTTTTFTTTSTNTLAIGFGSFIKEINLGANSQTLTTGFTNVVQHIDATGAGTWTGTAIVGSQQVSSSGTLVSLTDTSSYGGSVANEVSAALLVIGSPPADTIGWQLKSDLATIQNQGVTITPPGMSARRLNFSTGMTATDDGFGNETITATGTAAGANPTATASDTVVNGSATTFMRSDATPPVQKASASQFGIVKVDGTTITATAGVISATGGGGGGTTNNYAGNFVLIQSITLSAAQPSVTFSSIPQGYQDLVLVVNARGDAASTSTAAGVQINGDTGSNYDQMRMYANNGNTPTQSGVFASDRMYLGDFTSATGPSGVSTLATLEIGSYAGTTFQKQSEGYYGTKLSNTNASGNLYTFKVSNWWRSSSAVTSLTIPINSGNWVAGSNFSLYGRGGANVTVNPQPGLPVICEVVTSGSQSSVTIGGGSGACPTLPQTYRDLLIVVSGSGTKSATFTEVHVQINGDTSADYVQQFKAANNTTDNDGTNLTNAYIEAAWIPAATGVGSDSSTSQTTIYNYANTTLHKSFRTQGGVRTGTLAANMFYQDSWGVWTAAPAGVTSIKVAPDANAFVDGTVVTVYGIGGSPTATLPLIPPETRLSLTSGVAVMTADATAQTTIYDVPYQGNMVPVGGIMYQLASQLSYGLNTSAHLSGNLYDIGVFNNGGTLALCTAPAWTNSTTRSAAISQVNGIWVNTASLTCNLTSSNTTTTIAAGQWTYEGTFYATANGQTGMQFRPSSAAGGSNNILGLWNAYNRVEITSLMTDSNGTWTIGTANSDINFDGSTNSRITMVDGLGQSFVHAAVSFAFTATSGSFIFEGICENTTSTACIGFDNGVSTQSTNVNPANTNAFTPQLGLNYFQVKAHAGNTTSTSLPNEGGETIDVQMAMPLALLPIIRRRKPRNASTRRAANDNGREDRKVA